MKEYLEARKKDLTEKINNVERDMVAMIGGLHEIEAALSAMDAPDAIPTTDQPVEPVLKTQEDFDRAMRKTFHQENRALNYK